MGVQTRSSVSNSPAKSKSSTKVILPSADEEPYKIFVLPSDTSEDARFVLLKNPRDSARRRYYFCPLNGVFEVTKINAGGHDPRSILFAPQTDGTTPQAQGRIDKLDTAKSASSYAEEVKAENVEDGPFGGYVNKSAEIFVTTPFDPVFILLPLVVRAASSSRTQTGESHFRPFEDMLDEYLDDDNHLRYILTNTTFRPKLLKAMNHICDTIEAGDEQMFRLSMLKLNKHILTKARRVVENGLPASLEDHFVTRSLEVPVQSVKREESIVQQRSGETDVAAECSTPDRSDSQSDSASTVASVATLEASSATSLGTIEPTPSADLAYLQRLRTALSFITASYLDPALAEKLADSACDCKTSADFGPLDDHLQKLAQMRIEALATHSLSNLSKKRSLDDDEAAEDRVEKKRKQEEEDKKKKCQESRGVRDLKKVNVSGMKKMSDFFAKKAPAAKTKS